MPHGKAGPPHGESTEVTWTCACVWRRCMGDDSGPLKFKKCSRIASDQINFMQLPIDLKTASRVETG
jgi:hypothetical protein